MSWRLEPGGRDTAVFDHNHYRLAPHRPPFHPSVSLTNRRAYTKLAYAQFEAGLRDYDIFWRRLGYKPPIRSGIFADVGSGHGSMCLRLADEGARRVVGLDINASNTAFARDMLSERYPELDGQVEFHQSRLEELEPTERFDYIVTKDTFEHVDDLAGLLAEIERRLRPGGLLLAGFGPLYRSPRGDHGGAEVRLPWGHLIYDETRLVGRLNRRHDRSLTSLLDLGMNGLAFKDFHYLFRTCHLEPLCWRINRGDGSSLPKRFLYAFARAMAGSPVLREFLVFNVYAILRKSGTHR